MDPSYRDYASDASYMRDYAKYQERYATQVRESDKVLIELVRGVAASARALLDIGCSTGNLLLHLNRLVPGLSLTGGDLAGEVIEACAANPELEGISFRRLDVTALPPGERFDVVTANAMLCALDEEQFDAALTSIAGSLSPGGHLIAFDWFHPFAQELRIVEVTREFPGGFSFSWRSYGRVREALTRAGFADVEFTPFYVPIDLPPPEEEPPGVRTHTIRTDEGRRLSFRGALSQPWCHLVARRAS